MEVKKLKILKITELTIQRIEAKPKILTKKNI